MQLPTGGEPNHLLFAFAKKIRYCVNKIELFGVVLSSNYFKNLYMKTENNFLSSLLGARQDQSIVIPHSLSSEDS